MIDRPDVQMAVAVRFAHELESRQQGKHGLERRSQLAASQVGAEAEVHTVTERYVPVGLPADVEAVWLGEGGVVPVG